jgi:hypothetical protein
MWLYIEYTVKVAFFYLLSRNMCKFKQILVLFKCIQYKEEIARLDLTATDNLRAYEVSQNVHNSPVSI